MLSPLFVNDFLTWKSTIGCCQFGVKVEEIDARVGCLLFVKKNPPYTASGFVQFLKNK